MTKPTRAEMAALVERLHTAPCWLCSGDCAGANPPVTDCPVKMNWQAAAAIEALMQERAEPVLKIAGLAEVLRWRDRRLTEAGICKPNPVLSTSCYLGTKCCDVEHVPDAAPPAKPAGELPPLPAPVFLFGGGEYYTEPQLRAYALRAMRERE